jgi:hypothetical protein
MSISDDEISTWELRRGSDVLAKLEVTEQDFPWNFGRIFPSTAFEALRHLFRVQPDPESVKAVREQLRQQQVVLSPLKGVPVREFTLIVEGELARFQFV